ncbi:tol-pal system YbgF family protein [uncultured Chitinophaga sp.]|uniref:tetratricopeptide repeat protein n=1 Tax=uncultured Chitinophaga sp. TaxID=339340 RepID=UPI0025E148AD|nr:O-antigen ligase family protein [uncultured Chitinophaga sp.]
MNFIPSRIKQSVTLLFTIGMTALIVASALGDGIFSYHALPLFVITACALIIAVVLPGIKQLSLSAIDAGIVAFAIFLFFNSAYHDQLLNPTTYSWASIFIAYLAFRLTWPLAGQQPFIELTLLLAWVIIGIVVLYQTIGPGSELIRWPFGSSAICAYFMVLCLVATLQINRSQISVLPLVAFNTTKVLVVCLLLGCLVLSGSRISLLVSVFVLACKYLWTHAHSVPNGVIRYGRIAVVVVMVIAPLFWYINKDHSTAGRMYIYKVSASILADHWTTGIGAASFATRYAEYKATNFESGNFTSEQVWLDDAITVPYNEFLFAALAWGIGGVVAVVALVIGAIVLVKKDRTGNRGMDTALYLITFGILSLTGYPFHALFFGVIATSVVARMASLAPQWTVQGRMGFRLIMLAGITSAVVFSGDRIYAIWLWQSRCTQEPSLEQYQKYAGKLSDYPVYNYQHGVLLFESGYYDQAIKKLRQAHHFYENDKVLLYIGQCYQNLGDTRQAENQYKRHMATYPNRLRAAYHLFSMYKDLGDTTKARGYGEVLLQRPVKVPSEWTKQVRRQAEQFLKST